MLYVGEGPRGSNGAHSTLHWISVFHSATHNQTGPLWCWFPSGWACACPRPLCVSPRTSPVRLGVSPAATPTPTGIFNQRSEALFPRTGALGCAVCFAPRRLSGLSVRECGASGYYPPLCLSPFSATLSPALSVYLRECGAAGSASGQTAFPLSSHTPPVSVPATRVLSAPVPVSAPPTSLDEFLFFISLVSDFLAIRFSVSSGCVRRRSVSTYAAILTANSQLLMTTPKTKTRAN